MFETMNVSNIKLQSVYDEVKSSVMLKILITVCIATWIYWIWSRRKYYLISMKLPGPMSFPILGNSIELGAFGKGHEVVERIHNISKRYPSPFSIWAGLDFGIVITEPEDLEIVLTHKATSYKDKRYDMMKPCIGSGILSASGPLWKKHRQIVNPSFNVASLRSYQNIHNKHAMHLVQTLEHFCNTGPVETIEFCKRCTGDILAETLFGEEMEYYKGDKDHLLELTSTIAELMHDRLTKFWQEWEILYKISSEYKSINDYLKKYRSFYHSMIREKLKNYVDKKNLELELEHDLSINNILRSRTTFETLAEALISGKLTEQEVLDEFDNIYNPGMDTTYSQIGFFMMVLGMHKSCQDKLWSEIKEFYKDDLDAEVVTEHLRNLPYLEMCVKELIRLFPTGPVFTRYVTEDFELKSRDLIVPAGTYLLISIYVLHRNSKYWQEPNSFMPERFSPEVSKNRPHLAFLPFSYGQRNCIGQNFAMDMLRTIGVHLIRNFEFHSDLTMETLKTKADISMRSAVGYKVSITRRKRDI